MQLLVPKKIVKEFTATTQMIRVEWPSLGENTAVAAEGLMHGAAMTERMKIW